RDGVTPASHERHRAAPLRRPLVSPLINEQNAIHIKTDAVVRGGVKSVRFAEQRLNIARPADGEMVGADFRVRGARAPIEVHGWVNAHKSWRARKVGMVGIIIAG